MTVKELISTFIDPLEQEIEVIAEDAQTILFSGKGKALPESIAQREIIAIANINNDFKALSVSVESEAYDK